ncbi:hypothetical protein [Cytobacillus pseudoceanisediminis]
MWYETGDFQTNILRFIGYQCQNAIGQEIKVVDTDLAGNPRKLASTAKELTTYTFANRAATETFTTAFVIVKNLKLGLMLEKMQRQM